MDKTFSVMLDLLRFVAASLVFFAHAEQLLRSRFLSAVGSFGHDSVIFFFLLSGFVIGYVSDCKEKSLSEYFVARAARIYSVAIPSLMLAYLLFMVTNSESQYVFGLKPEASDWYILGSSLLFLNQTWLALVDIPLNPPYWSISYEVWYYVIFGVAFYVKGFKKFMLVLLAMALAGPRILVLMPIWLAGVAFYKVHRKIPKHRLAGYSMLVGALAVYFGMRATNFDDTMFSYTASLLGGKEAVNLSLGFSKRFLPDFVIGALYLTMICGLWMVSPDLKNIMNRLQAPIRLLSAQTFSLYLFHVPLLAFFAQYTANSIAVMAASLVCIALLGHVTERKKGDLALTLKNLVRA